MLHKFWQLEDKGYFVVKFLFLSSSSCAYVCVRVFAKHVADFHIVIVSVHTCMILFAVWARLFICVHGARGGGGGATKWHEKEKRRRGGNVCKFSKLLKHRAHAAGASLVVTVMTTNAGSRCAMPYVDFFSGGGRAFGRSI